MKAINKRSKITINWKIQKGSNKSAETFTSLDNVKVFLVGSGNTYYFTPTINEDYSLTVVVEKNALREGVYDLKAFWKLNEGRSLMTSVRTNVFGITDTYEEDLSGDEVVNIVSYVEAYGRDGLSAYQAAVLRGLEVGSELEWLTKENMFVHNEEQRIADFEAAQEARQAEFDSKEAIRDSQEAERQESYYRYTQQVYDGGRADTKYGEAVRVLDCGGADAYV